MGHIATIFFNFKLRRIEIFRKLGMYVQAVQNHFFSS